MVESSIMTYMVVQRSTGELMHRLYHPHVYPLLFPCGTDAAGNVCCPMLRDLSQPMAVTAERQLRLTEWGRLAFVYRIECQARGLPHVHMLLIFASSGSTCPFPAPTPTQPPTLQTTLHNDGHQEALHAVPPITSPSLAAPRSTRAASLQLQ
jgi:hypothetical protein